MLSECAHCCLVLGAQHDELPSHPSDDHTATIVQSDGIVDGSSPYAGWPVASAEIDGKGRGVVAKRAMNAGDVAYQAMPWAAVVGFWTNH